MTYVEPFQQIKGEKIEGTEGEKIEGTEGEKIKNTEGKQIKDTKSEQVKDTRDEVAAKEDKDKVGEAEVGVPPIKNEVKHGGLVKQKIKEVEETTPSTEGKLVEHMMGSIVRQAVEGGSHLIQAWLNRRGGN